MEETYFVINNSDGDTTVTIYTKKELLKGLEDKDWGNISIMTKDILYQNSDTNYWDNNILIIKGTICIPKPKRVIETYDID